MKRSGELKTHNDDVVNEGYIKARCDDLLQEAGIKSIPIDLPLLASFAGISRIERVVIQEAGMLCPARNGDLVVLLRESDSPRRQNFTCAHEISHTFIPGYREKPQKRVDVEVGKYDRYNQIEYLCDFGASYMLMPDAYFKPLFKKQGFSLNALLNLSEAFAASLEATAIRMVSQDPSRYAVVVWEERLKPIEERMEHQLSFPGIEITRPEKKLRVKFGYGFDKSGHIPKHKSLEESLGILACAYKRGTRQEGAEEISFGRTFSKSCDVFALPLPRQNRVISLLIEHQ